MSKLRLLTIALLASASFLPSVALAQSKDQGFDVSETPATETQQGSPMSKATSLNQIDLGVGYVSQSSSVFGRYNGMPYWGETFLGGWSVQRRDASDSGGVNYMSFTGERIDTGRLTLPEATIQLKAGQQGRWWVQGDYDAMTYTATDHFTTLLDEAGHLSPAYVALLTANGAFFTNSPTGNLAGKTFYGTYKTNASTGITSASGNHVAIYGPQSELMQRIGTRRDKGSIGAGYFIGPWLVSGSLSHEHKAGSLENAMTTGGSNTGMMTFPMPINYDTDIYSASAAYSGKKLQAVLSYEFSDFKDNQAGYAFDGWNFTGVRTQTGPNLFTAFQQSGVYALPPSNQAHTFSLQLGYNATPTTRLTGTFVYGIQRQDEPFVSPTLNAYTLAALAPQFAAQPHSLDGYVETFFGATTLTAQPWTHFDVKFNYTVDRRDPHTHAMWIYGDPTDAVDNIHNIKFREAVPEAWTKQTASLSGIWHMARNTSLTLGYTWRDADRTNAITHHAIDNEEQVKLQHTFGNGGSWSNGMASLGYVHAERSASAPDFSMWLTQIVSDCGSSLALLGCQQIPFYMAARTEDSVTGMLSGMAGPKTTFSLYAKWDQNEYHLPNAIYNSAVNPGVGINRDYSWRVAPDVTFQPNKDTDIHLFYTFMRVYRDMRALNNQSAPGGNFYNVATTFDLQTAGVAFKRQMSPKLKIGAHYLYSYGTQAYAQSGTWANNEASQAFGGDPNLSTRNVDHQVQLFMSYAASDRLQWRLSYRYDTLDATDWALVGATVGQVITGDLPPKYNVSTVLAAMSLKF